MKKLNKNLTIVAVAVFVAFGFAGPIAAHAATTPSLGAATTYGILASTYTNTTAGTTVTGDIGFTTGAPVRPAGVQTNYGSGAPYSTAGTDQGSAASALAAAAQPCTFTFAPGPINLSTDTTHSSTTGTYGPGVYCSTGAMDVGGPLTLNGAGTYIFRPAGALTSDTGSIVTLTGSASVCDVFWTPTQATTLAATSTFMGTVIDDSGITLGANVTWTGRALAFGGTVTTASDNITVPTTCAAPATLHVIKLVVGGTAAASDFSVHVKSAGVDVTGSPTSGAAAPGTRYSLNPGTYTVSEGQGSSYTQSFSGTGCDASGNVTLSAGQDAICTVVNTAVTVPVVPSVSSGGGGGTGGGRIVPLIGVVKVPTPLALPTGTGPVTYNYTVWNVGGQQALDNVSVTDDKCSPVTYVSGDLNGNGKLDPHENWKYSCTTTLSTTTVNTAIATGYSDDTYHQASIATAVATVVVAASTSTPPLTPPLINIVKVPSRLTPFPFGGGNVTYTYTVTNPGVVAMHNVIVADNKCSQVSYVSGDANGNNLLEPGEIWTYTCQTNVPVSTMNTATAEGSANGFTAIGYAFATVLVATPGLPNTGFPPAGNNMPWGILILMVGILMIVSVSMIAILKKRRI